MSFFLTNPLQRRHFCLSILLEMPANYPLIYVTRQARAINSRVASCLEVRSAIEAKDQVPGLYDHFSSKYNPETMSKKKI
jgi:hypothetical protein